MKRQSPIQLIMIDKDGICTLNNEADKYLSQINNKIGVICIAGLYRTGKSYLLNRLLNRQDGFEIGPTTLSCTKGLWIWGETVYLKEQDMELLFIDTEGLGSAFEDRNETIDMQIFCLSMLLSSLFIYNCMKNIDQTAIESLAMVTNFAKKVQSQFESIESYSANYPSFLWVIRDFALNLVNSQGNAISANQYLENSLTETESPTNEEQSEKNDIKKTIKTFFKDRSCFTLVRPVADEKQLRIIDKVDYSEIRDDFKDQMSLLVKEIYESVRPKIVQGTYVNGSMLSGLIKQYISAINSNSIPDVKTSWKIVVERQIQGIIENVYF